MNINSAFPSKYLKVADLNDKKVRLTIAGVEMEQVDTKKPDQPVLYFRGQKKALVLNVTNKNFLVKLYGEETDNWIGQPIILKPAETEYAGDTVPCIRFDKPAPVEAKVETKPANQPVSDTNGDIDNIF